MQAGKGMRKNIECSLLEGQRYGYKTNSCFKGNACRRNSCFRQNSWCNESCWGRKGGSSSRSYDGCCSSYCNRIKEGSTRCFETACQVNFFTFPVPPILHFFQ